MDAREARPEHALVRQERDGRAAVFGKAGLYLGRLLRHVHVQGQVAHVCVRAQRT